MRTEEIKAIKKSGESELVPVYREFRQLEAATQSQVEALRHE